MSMIGNILGNFKYAKKMGMGSRGLCSLIFLYALVATSAIVLAGDLESDLRKAAEKGDAEKIQSLLDKGADVNATDGRGRSALFKAAEKGHLDVVRLLIKEGADQFDVSEDLEKALGKAAEKGELKNIQCLLEAGVNPNAAKKDSRTALILAAEKRHWNAVKLIIDHGGSGGYLILYEESALELQKNLNQALKVGFRILRTSNNCGTSGGFYSACALLEHSNSNHMFMGWNAPSFSSMQQELDNIASKGFRILPNVIEKDPGQQYLYLIDSDSSKLQEKLDQASALGFRVQMISHLNKPEEDSDIAILLEISDSPEKPHEYFLFEHFSNQMTTVQGQRDRLLFLQKELNKIAEKGYRIVPNTLIAKSLQVTTEQFGYRRNLLAYICLLEKGGQKSKQYKYEIPPIHLFWGYDQFKEADKREIAEAHEEGYIIVSAEPYIVMEKEIE